MGGRGTDQKGTTWGDSTCHYRPNKKRLGSGSAIGSEVIAMVAISGCAGPRKNKGASQLHCAPFLNGAPGRIRTCDLRIRSPALYPAELRARNKQFESGMLHRI